jgi:DNA modification methylase
VKQKKNWGNITQEMLIKNSKEKNEKIETLKQEIKKKPNGNEQLWEEIGEREEYIMNTNILSIIYLGY